MKLKFSRRSGFYILLSILLAFVAIRYVFYVNIPRMLLAGIVILMAALGERDEIIAISMGCIVLHEAINFYITIAACGVILLLKNVQRLRHILPIVLVAVMIMWELLHCFAYFWTPVMLLAALAPFLFLAALCCIDLKNVDYTFVVRTMTLITFFMCVILLVNHIVEAGGNLTVAFANMTRLGMFSEEETMFGNSIHPNSLGVINVLCISGLLQIRALGKNKKIDLFYMIGLMVMGALTMSRTFLLCLGIMAFMLWIAQKGLVKKLRFLGGILIVVVLAVTVINLIFPDVLLDFMGRFQVGDITTGRGDLLIAYNDFILSNNDVLLFGVGISDYVEKVVDIYQVASVTSHNGIQEIVIVWGLPGLMLIGGLIGTMMFNSAKYCRKKRILNYIPLFIILAKSMVGQMITSGYTVLALGFAYLSLCQDFQPSNRMENKRL